MTDRLKDYLRKKRWTLVSGFIAVLLYGCFRLANANSPSGRGMAYELLFLVGIILIPFAINMFEIMAGKTEIEQEPEWAWSNAVGALILVVIILLIYLVYKFVA